jgi:hypothetical protein
VLSIRLAPFERLKTLASFLAADLSMNLLICCVVLLMGSSPQSLSSLGRVTCTAVFTETGSAAIEAIVEMKRRNRTWSCKRIAQQIAPAFSVEIDKDVVRRILGIHFRPEAGSGRPSWLSFIVTRNTRCGP